MALRRQVARLARHLHPEQLGPSTSGRGDALDAAAALCRRSLSGRAAAGEAAATGAAAAAGAREAPGALRRARALLRDYKQLSKFRLGALVVATSAAGFVAGSGESVDWARLGWTSLGTMLCSSAANALNQLYEVASDARMRRTAARPLPTGRLSRPHAALFAAACAGAGVFVLQTKANTLTAALGAGNIALYAGVYTPLKAVSVANTWVGAVVGAVPPLMGWAAAAGGLDAGALILAAALYFWQMPHFMALAWLCRADYAAGGYRMLSLVDPSGRRTAACALRNCAYLFPLGGLATWLGVTSPYFAYESAFITAGMALTAATFYASPTSANARLLFRASLLHLPVFMAAFLLHRRPNTGDLDRGQLLVLEARRLGFGEPLERPPRPAGLTPLGEFMSRVSVPPLPLLPVPHLAVSCPSKAACQTAEEPEEADKEDQEAEEAGNKGGRQQQAAVARPRAAHRAPTQ